MTTQTAVLGLINIAAGCSGWGLARYVLGKYPFQGVPGLRFCKVLGSGFNGGFGTKPSLTKQGFFCSFDSAESAAHFLNNAPLLRAYQDHSNEMFTATLQPYSSRGSWSGFSLHHLVAKPTQGPIASLTRASIRPSKAIQFWNKAKPAEDSIKQAHGKILTAGLGEAPYLRQATFTIWNDEQALDHYAQQGAHLAAIKAAYGKDFFSESMFTRFVVKSAKGVWQGKHVEIS